MTADTFHRVVFQKLAHAGAVDVLTATAVGARVLISFQAVEKQHLHAGKRGTTTVLEADCNGATPRSHFVQLYIVVHFLGCVCEEQTGNKPFMVSQKALRRLQGH